LPIERVAPLSDPHILDMRVDSRVLQRVLTWARVRESRYVCCAGARSVLESLGSPEFRTCVNAADLVISGGLPFRWALRRSGLLPATRVRIPELMQAVLREADRESLRVGFYGGDPDALTGITEPMDREFPGLVGFQFARPFRELTQPEDDMLVDRINRSGVQILFVGLGCPEQETWMASHKNRVRAVMLGVGMAFTHLGHAAGRLPSRSPRPPESFWRRRVPASELWKRMPDTKSAARSSL